MNDRLGAIGRKLGAEDVGADLTPLSMEWLAEMVPFGMADQEDASARTSHVEESEDDA